MYHCFFIHSSVNGHLACFHVLAIVNSAAMNIGIHVSLWILVSSGYMARSEVAGSYGGFIPSFLRNLCASSSPAFHMMYSAYKLNKQSDNIQPWHTPLPIWNQSVVPYPVLTVASWPEYRFLRRQVKWAGYPISLRIFHSLLWSTQSKALT